MRRYSGMFTGWLGSLGEPIDRLLGTGSFVPHLERQPGLAMPYKPIDYPSEEAAKNAFRYQFNREPKILPNGDLE